MMYPTGTKILLHLLLGLILFLSLSGPEPALAQTAEKETSAKVVSDQPGQTPANVRSFGAKGDGVVDDSIPVQAALDSLKENGTLFFPKGQYLLTQTIRIPSYVRICGESIRSTILLYKGSDKAFVSGDRTNGRYGTGSYHITIENITIRGIDRGVGLYLTSRYLTMSNVEVSHFATGIDCHACWTNKYYLVSFFDNTVAFRGGAYLNANSFINCIFATGRNAVTFIQGANVSFIGCQFEAYTDACFSFNEETKSQIWDLNITGCYFENKAKCLDIGPNGSVSQLNLVNNFIAVNCSGPAIRIDNRNNYGRNSGLVENNTFIRDDQASTEPFVHLEGLAYIIFRANKAYAVPDYQTVQLLDSYTKYTHTTSIEEDLGEFNRLRFTGIGTFDKGIVIGGIPSDAAEKGLVIYENGRLKLYHEAGQSEYLQAVKSGPSANRPGGSPVGTVYFDTTLNQPLWWNGTDWVDAAGVRK